MTQHYSGVILDENDQADCSSILSWLSSVDTNSVPAKPVFTLAWIREPTRSLKRKHLGDLSVNTTDRKSNDMDAPSRMTRAAAAVDREKRSNKKGLAYHQQQPKQGRPRTPVKADIPQRVGPLNDDDDDDDDDDDAAADNADETPHALPPLKKRDIKIPKLNPSSSASSNGTRKSRSPIRKRALAAGADSISFGTFNNFLSKLPERAQNLFNEVEEVSNGIGALPLSFRDENRSLLDPLAKADRKLGRNTFYSSGPTSATDKPLSVKFVRKISKRSDEYQRRGAPEAQWNTFVHAELLEKAVKPYDLIEAVNMTHIAIHPPELKPTLRTDASPGSKVDFGLVIQSDEIRNRLQQLAIEDVNQVNCEYIAYEPLAISIETKIFGQGFSTAQSQIGIWLFAQFAKLEQLLDSVPAFLPALIVQGDKWSFLIVVREYSPAMEQPGRFVTHVLHGLDIGSTAEESGVWQICRALRILAKWSEEEYAPWIRAQLNKLLSIDK